MTRRVETRPPSFPEVAPDRTLDVAEGLCWQVLCGDTDHWRVGVYSPPEASAEEVGELERHNCPELFCLLDGRLTLTLADGQGGVRLLELERGKPVLVSVPHSGFCPDGPHSGRALVVERDAFDTEYRPPEEW